LACFAINQPPSSLPPLHSPVTTHWPIATLFSKFSLSLWPQDLTENPYLSEQWWPYGHTSLCLSWPMWQGPIDCAFQDTSRSIDLNIDNWFPTSLAWERVGLSGTSRHLRFGGLDSWIYMASSSNSRCRQPTLCHW
jgi:hypothetical protein